MNKNEVSEYLKNLDKDTNTAAVEIDGKTYIYERKSNGWEGALIDESVKKLIKEGVDEGVKTADLQTQLDTEKENSVRLKTITEQLLQEKIKRGELKEKDIPAYLQGDHSGRDSKKGGGVMKLDEHGKTAQDYVYSSISEGVDDLYSRVRKGDKEARKKLDELKKLAIDDIKIRSAKNESFYLVQCTNCKNMVDVNKISGSKCPYCDTKLGISG